MNGASVKHGHDLANKIFGNEISKRQNLCADELDDLKKEDTTSVCCLLKTIGMELQSVCSPRHQRLHSSEILEWRDYLGACCKRTTIKNNDLRVSILSRSTFITRLYLLVKRKSSKALASSGHIVSNFPEEACCRATGNPMDSTLSRDDTASFQVLSDGQAYFKPSGIFKVWREIKRENKNCWVTKSTFTIGLLQWNIRDVTDLYCPIFVL